MVPEARRVKVISFDEAAELAYFGARVLHPATILPAVRKKIPVHVLNSYRPEADGTLITEEAPSCENPVKAIAYKKGITIINITFVVDEDRLTQVVRGLHDVFFQKPDPLIFE
jgi:aspartate kinase